MMMLRAAVRPGSVDIEQRTAELTWTTGAKGRRWSWDVGSYMEELEVSEKAVRLDRLNNGAPLLNAHASWELRDVIGVVEKAWIEGGEGRAMVRFSQREDADEVFRDVKDGILRNISVGYAVHRYEVTEEDDDKLPVYRATDWEPLELSLVPIGFDDGAKVRAAGKPDEYQGQRFTTDFIMREAEKPADQPAAVAIQRGEPEMDEAEKLAAEQQRQADIKKAADAAVEAERKRGETIRSMARKVGLGEDVADDMVARNVSVEAASAEMINKLAERSQAQPDTRTGVRTQFDNTNQLALRTGLELALGHRISPSAVKLEGDNRQYRGMNLLAMAAECIRAAGGEVRGLMPREIAQAAMNCNASAVRAAGMHSTSDFPVILANTVSKALLAAYALAPQTFRPFTRQRTVSDFKPISLVTLGDATPFQKVNEGGEYKYGTLGEQGVTLQVLKYGEIIAITWEAIVNDDLGAFTRIPAALGVAAMQKESDIIWNLILTNPNFIDGQPIFSAAHNNLAGAGSAISVASLAAGRAAMRNQKSLGGNYLSVAPQYLIVGPAKELEAYQFTSSNYVPAKNGDINPSQNTQLEVIVEPRITDNSWYLSAAPGLIDTIEYAYLEGEQGVFTETREGFEVDGLEVKARLVFGAQWVDYRGVYKNPGA